MPPATTNPSTPSETHQVVHSPEQYRLDLPLAGPTSRILAYGIDYVAIVIIGLLVLALLFALFPLAQQMDAMMGEVAEAALSDDPNTLYESTTVLILLGFVIILQLAIEWVYFVFLEMTTGGRSLGKAIVKLRVVGDGGHP